MFTRYRSTFTFGTCASFDAFHWLTEVYTITVVDLYCADGYLIPCSLMHNKEILCYILETGANLSYDAANTLLVLSFLFHTITVIWVKIFSFDGNNLDP